MSRTQPPEASSRYQLVPQVGLSVAVLSVVGLLGLLAAVSTQATQTYAQSIAAFGFARESLAPAMIAFGVLIAGTAGLIAGLFAMWASFRVAGPVYRICRELERQVQGGHSVPTPIRANDDLQQEWRDFEVAIATLRGQRDELQQAIEQVRVELGGGQRPQTSAGVQRALAHLKKVEDRVRY